MRWIPTIADISSAHGFILLLFYYYDSEFFSRRNAEAERRKKDIKNRLYVSRRESFQFYNTSSQFSHFRWFHLCSKEKSWRTEKVRRKKVDKKRIHGRRCEFREHELFIVDTISCLLWFTTGANSASSIPSKYRIRCISDFRRSVRVNWALLLLHTN